GDLRIFRPVQTLSRGVYICPYPSFWLNLRLDLRSTLIHRLHPYTSYWSYISRQKWTFGWFRASLVFPPTSGYQRGRFHRQRSGPTQKTKGWSPLPLELL